MMQATAYTQSKYLRRRGSLQDALPAWRKLYCVLFPFCFILNGYSSGFDGLSLGAAIISLFCAAALLFSLTMRGGFRWGRGGCCSAPLLLAGFYLLCSLVALLTLGDPQYAAMQMLVDLAKIFIWAISISLVTYLFMDYALFKKWLLRVCILSTLYLFLQYIAWYSASVFLPGIFDLPVLAPYVEEYADYARYIASASRSFRPSSLFSEPAFYSNVTLCGLAIHLFDSAKAGWTPARRAVAVVLSMGLLLSTSTSGIYALILLWLFFFSTGTRRHIAFNLIFAALAVLIVLSLLDLQYESFVEDLGVFGATFLNAISKPLSFMSLSRGGKSFAYLNGLVGINRLIGVGFGNAFPYLGISAVYLNTFTNLVLSAGYIGVAAFVLFVLSLLRHDRDLCSLYLIGIYVIKLFSSGIMFNPFGILFLSMAIYRSRYMKAEDHEPTNQPKRRPN